MQETSYHDYTKASAQYDLYRKPYGLSQLRQLLKRSKTPIPLIADMGCGTGNHLIALEDMYEKAIGIDINEAMLGQFKKKLTEQGLETKIEIKQGSCLQLPLPSDSCDVVLMTQVLHHLGNAESRQKAFNEAYRVLKPQGFFLMNHTYDKQIECMWPRGLLPHAKKKTQEIEGSLQDLLRFGGTAGFAFQTTITLYSLESKYKTYSESLEGSSSYFSILSTEEKAELKMRIEKLQKENKTLYDLDLDLATGSILGDSMHLLFLKE